MAFPTQPAEDPEWASGGTVTVPSGAKRILGWIFQEKPPFDFFNWYMFRVYEWIVFLRGYLNVDHDIVTGHHTVVYVQTRLDIEATAPARYVLGAGSQSSRDVEFDIGSTDKGGWGIIVGTRGTQFDYNLAGTPPNTANQGVSDTFTHSYNLDGLINGQDDVGAGDQWVLNRIRINRRVTTGAESVVIRVLSMARTGTAAVTVESTTTTTVTGATYATQTISPTINIDPSRRYWVEVICTAGAGAVAGDVGFAGVSVKFARLHLE
jgi:hypothetical protein